MDNPTTGTIRLTTDTSICLRRGRGGYVVSVRIEGVWHEYYYASTGLQTAHGIGASYQDARNMAAHQLDLTNNTEGE